MTERPSLRDGILARIGQIAVAVLLEAIVARFCCRSIHAGFGGQGPALAMSRAAHRQLDPQRQAFVRGDKDPLNRTNRTTSSPVHRILGVGPGLSVHGLGRHAKEL